ncbi:hypothetical protein [Mycolicibacterium mageritense]|uniref:hypothetical protein n=1 Tax=Mycolicibacterium mageritense TaxID=53462 RepID=UPI0011D496FF|nr:hypothetical protein [Mycolicibacterium mageritense]TXI63396.1 MAG: hypothetical protein E6Q55_09545 [Mycolicibacterium mageritense]
MINQGASRTAYFPDTFEYVLVSRVDHAAPVSRDRVRDSLFHLQDDLVEHSAAITEPMTILQREVEPWTRFDDTLVTADAQMEFTLGSGTGEPDNEKFTPYLSMCEKPVRTLVEAQRQLIQVLRSNHPWAEWSCILYRPVHQWEPPAGAEAAVAVVHEHIAAAAAGDVETLRGLATGPLSDDMDRLTDAEIRAGVRGVYDNVPSVMVLARNDPRPGHHHVLTNSTLHFDVDDSTGSWLIRQVRLMSRPDRFGTLPFCWRGLLAPEPDETLRSPQ